MVRSIKAESKDMKMTDHSALPQGIERFDFIDDDAKPHADMQPASDGAWVRYADHAARLQQVEKRCSDFQTAIQALYTAVRTDEHGQWWPIRKWLDERDIFNDDIGSGGAERLVEEVCKYLITQERGR